MMHQGMHCWRLGGLLGEAKAGLHACISDSLRAGARRPHGVEARSAQGARSRPPDGGQRVPAGVDGDQTSIAAVLPLPRRLRRGRCGRRAQATDKVPTQGRFQIARLRASAQVVTC